MKISELARAADTSRDTVRHYVELGLLQVGRNPDNGYQIFDEAALKRLNFIRTARGLGLRLQDIQLIFADAKNVKSPCPRVRQMMEQRIAATRERIVELTGLCERMEKAMDDWRNMPNSTPNGSSVCGLIESRWSESQESTVSESAVSESARPKRAGKVRQTKLNRENRNGK